MSDSCTCWWAWNCERDMQNWFKKSQVPTCAFSALLSIVGPWCLYLLTFFLTDFTDGEPIKLPDNLESLPRADSFPSQRHRWNTNEVSFSSKLSSTSICICFDCLYLYLCFYLHLIAHKIVEMGWPSESQRAAPKGPRTLSSEGLGQQSTGGWACHSRARTLWQPSTTSLPAPCLLISFLFF